MKRNFALLFLMISIVSVSFGMEQNGPWNTLKEQGEEPCMPESVSLKCSDGNLELTRQQAGHFQTIEEFFNDNLTQEKTFDLSEYATCQLMELLKIDIDINYIDSVKDKELFPLLKLALYLGAERPIFRGLAQKIKARNINLSEEQKELLDKVVKPITIENLIKSGQIDLSDCIKQKVESDGDGSIHYALILDKNTAPSLESLDGIESVISQEIRDKIARISIKDVPLETIDCQKLYQIFSANLLISVHNCPLGVVKLSSTNDLFLQNNKIQEFKYPSTSVKLNRIIAVSGNNLLPDQVDVLKQFCNIPAFADLRMKLNHNIVEICGFLAGICTAFGVLLFITKDQNKKIIENLISKLNLSDWEPQVKILFCIPVMKISYFMADRSIHKLPIPTNGNIVIADNQNPTMGWKDLFFKYGL